jgi:hypothetical protein
VETARDRVAAPDVDLLDTLATAYLAAGRRADALRTLEDALTRAELSGDTARAGALRDRLGALRSR